MLEQKIACVRSKLQGTGDLFLVISIHYHFKKFQG